MEQMARSRRLRRTADDVPGSGPGIARATVVDQVPAIETHRRGIIELEWYAPAWSAWRNRRAIETVLSAVLARLRERPNGRGRGSSEDRDALRLLRAWNPSGCDSHRPGGLRHHAPGRRGPAARARKTPSVGC